MATFPSLSNPFNSNTFPTTPTLPSVNMLTGNNRYYDASGKELNYTPWEGTAYSADGSIIYTFKNGKVSVAANKGLPSSTKLNTTVLVDKKEYAVYRRTNGTYYYRNADNKEVDITNSAVVSDLNKNKNMCINLDRATTSTTETKPEAKPEAKPETNNTASAPTYSAPSYSAPKQDNAYIDQALADSYARIDELEKLLKPIGAAEAAKLYGIDYNEANILKEYNDSTNEYYDNAVKAQNDLRTQYARNNTQYVNQIADAYIDSYKNAAPTATGKGTLAANALSTQLQADSINAANDYGMMQSVNTLNEARAAELKNNPQAAKDYYNRIGTYLSGLSATKNASDVKQYVDQLDAYSQMYAADRSYQSYLAQANAAKYAGLTNAAATNAGSAAANSAWNQIYNYYLTTRGGDSYKADSNIANLLKASGGN